MDSNSQIAATIARLRRLTQASIQSGWRYHEGDLPRAEALQSEFWSQWPIAVVNARGHVAWERGRLVRWLVQRLVVPADLEGYPLEGLALRLSLLWWAEQVQVFVQGEWVQAGDLFDCAPRILLQAAVQIGETIDLALRLVSPGHDDGALMRALCLYEVPPEAGENRLEPGFVADELAVLEGYLAAFQPEQVPQMAAALSLLQGVAVTDRERFDQAITQLRQTLIPLATGLKQRRIGLLGHAHLDLAWLWPVSETWAAAERTFRSVLSLQQDFPDLIFCHSSPALYAWIEDHRPALFSEIQAQVAAGRWEVVGGMWVEPDLNLIGGESIVRQILYGQRYTQQKFGRISPIAWLPDTFGFTWQLPQLLKQGGIDYFVTQKLRWNDTTQFPYAVFQWQAPDRTQVLALMSAPIGEGIDPVKMTTHAWDWEQKTGSGASLWLPGVGDHGGGPTRDMLQVAGRWSHSPFFPEIVFTTAEAYLQQIAAQDARQALPVWDRDLYLEFHRGCYTTHADQKQQNRQCESLLYQAELFASLATLATGAVYPRADLERAWKHTLFNQFHDILPGSSIPEVFEEANQGWAAVRQIGEGIMQRSLQAIATQIQWPPAPRPEARPLVVFNPLNWERSEVVALPGSELSDRPDWQVLDQAGQPVPVQWSQRQGALLFWVAQIPSIGYRVFWLCPGEKQPESVPVATRPMLENDWLRVEVDLTTGNLLTVFDKVQQREVLQGSGNHLQAFQDSGQYWDAWNIDPAYQECPLPPAECLSDWGLEVGPLQTRLWVTRRVGQSAIGQDYVLSQGSPVLQIQTTVDWQERQTLLKAAFTFNLRAEVATYEIPLGAIARSTSPQTPAEKAQWEVPALRWADLSTGTYGVSLLNDCKYGYDAQPDGLRLTLLRGTKWPDFQADLGRHQFTYALYPHPGDWRSAHTVQRGYELNLPLQALVVADPASPTASLPARGSLLDGQAENLVFTALKSSEDPPQTWILRCYECHGEPASIALQSDLGLTIDRAVDLLENPVREQGTEVAPWQVVSFRLRQG
ncbi:alpha-mannosidase [Leptolyngbya sp. 'hensonii']|uniref:alpha-mannosidase n=1 Tax=Leptolyngbya sp. 'hensonii' TaxID=1922337 RepID=UPI00094FF19A|nr:alpha-mannosidase [Leptolyngbya sp. 'hensonii']OLP19431.1 alpha-mannosidase [Leptolyngbya sp. 'hensonii']